MYSQFLRLWSGLALTATSPLMGLVLSAFALADEEIAVPAAEELPAHRAVLRISEAMLNSLMGGEDVDRQADVRDSILGTSIYGRARIVAKPNVKLANSPDRATFYINFEGTVYSRTRGYNGPAIIHSRSVTKFLATKQVVFEPGKGFQALPPTVTARTQTYVEGIDSTRGGLIGRIIRRRAAKVAAARHAEATEIARQKIQRRIATAFERHSEERLARLNRAAELRSVALAALQMSAEPRYVCCTTPGYLQIATSFGASNPPLELPTRGAVGTLGAPIEIWLHRSLISDANAAVLDLLGAQVKASDFVKAVSAIASLAGGSAERNSQLRSLLGEKLVRVQIVGQWRVIEWDVPIGRLPSSAREQAPRAAETSPETARVEREPIPKPDESPVATLGYRIWTSGNYTAIAEFLALDGNIVRLRRNTGVNTSISLAKLSAADQAWIRKHLAQR